MPVNIAICDDSTADILLLKNALLIYDPFFEIETYTSGESFIRKYENSNSPVDILFLDIYIPDMNGIEIAQKIRKVRKDIKIIFLTSSKDHYPQAYEVFAYNYIVKPFDIKRLYSVLDHSLEDIRKENAFSTNPLPIV